MEAVTTERLGFKIPSAEDAEAIFGQMNDFDIIKYLTSVPWPYTRPDADAYVEMTRKGREEESGLYYLILDRVTRAVIGTIDLRFDPDRTAHFGYWIGKSFWGRGITSEALAALLTFGFGTLGLERIWGAAMPENKASIRVMEKCGLDAAGSIVVNRPNFGDSVDMDMLEMRRADWLARGGSVTVA